MGCKCRRTVQCSMVKILEGIQKKLAKLEKELKDLRKRPPQ